ncbi:hypothetical protein Tco_0185638 [Tanacetum coccineum]
MVPSCSSLRAEGNSSVRERKDGDLSNIYWVEKRVIWGRRSLITPMSQAMQLCIAVAIDMVPELLQLGIESIYCFGAEGVLLEVKEKLLLD